MRQTHVNLAAALVLSIAAAGCGSDPEVPPATSETQASRQSNQPTNVTGCLRAGDAANTFVLTTAATTGDASIPATYHLTSTGNLNLQDHVGKRVEVAGVVEAQSDIATRETPQPADNATGTAGAPGTPTVQTGTRLNIQRMNVTNIRGTGQDCGEQ